MTNEEEYSAKSYMTNCKPSLSRSRMCAIKQELHQVHTDAFLSAVAHLSASPVSKG
jgi:hypothetical protein